MRTPSAEAAQTPLAAPGFPRLLSGLSSPATAFGLGEHNRHWGALSLRTARTTLVDELDGSGLRGHGGAWFPVGTKWRSVSDGRARRPVVVANGAESGGQWEGRLPPDPIPPSATGRRLARGGCAQCESHRGLCAPIAGRHGRGRRRRASTLRGGPGGDRSGRRAGCLSLGSGVGGRACPQRWNRHPHLCRPAVHS